MLKISAITKKYAERCVLNIPSFSFEPGQRYALVGANGSGKTTLLRVLAGVIKPDSGMVECDHELKKQIGYMPQKPYIYDFSVAKNIQIACKEKNAQPDLVRQALERVDMLPFAAARGSRLSGGESQRIAFARMLVAPHPLLLLDEPTSAMDIAASEKIEKELLQYCAAHQSVLVFATHSLAQAQRLADVLILLHQGEIVEAGPPEQIIHAPQTEIAAEFLKNWQIV